MAPRALGALLAMVAAIAFVVSIASSAWWAGHPTVGGRMIEAKEVRAGLFGATGCNTGGDGKCESVPTGRTVKVASYVETGAIGLTTVLAFMLAASAWTIGDRRKALAKTTMVAALVTAAGGVIVLVLGPDLVAGKTIGVPIGWGAFVFGGAVVSTLIASMITRKLEPEPLRLKPGLAPPPPEAPLRASMPQMAPFSPTPYPQPYAAPPDAVNGLGATTLGLPPAPVRTKAPSAPPPPPRSPSPSVPPPVRTHAPSRPPPTVPTDARPAMLPRPGEPLGPPVDPFARTPISSPRIRAAPASNPPPRVPPPARPEAKPPVSPPGRARTVPGPGTDPLAKPLPAPTPVQPEPRPSQPTIAHAIPPMPAVDNQPSPGVSEPTARGTLDPRIASRAARSATDVRTGRSSLIGDITATATTMPAEEVADDAADGATSVTVIPAAPSASRIITGEERGLSTMQRSVARAATEDAFDTGRSQIVPPDGPLSEEMPAASPDVIAAALASEDAGPVTDVHDIPSVDELMRGPISTEIASVSGAIGEATDARRSIDDLPARDRSGETPIPTVHERGPAQLPMSTAPASLPPPKATEAAASGPTPACPQCESPMAWVDEHLRFYCKQCRMYF